MIPVQGVFGIPRVVLRRLLLAALFLVSAWGVYPAARAQDQPAESESPQPVVEPVTKPLALPASQITHKSSETAGVLRSLRDRPIIDQPIEDIGEVLPDALGDYYEFLEETEALLSTTISVRKFDDLQRRWTRIEERITDWAAVVNRRAESLDRDLETLQELRITWEATLATAEQAGFQESQIEVIQSSIREVSSVEKYFGEGQAELLTIQTQLRSLYEYVQEARALIEHAKSTSSSPLFAFEAPAIWRVAVDQETVAANFEQFQTIWRDGLRDLAKFFSREEPLLIRFLVLWLGLALVLVYLKRKAVGLVALETAADGESTEEQGAPDTHITHAGEMLTRPISAAMVLTLWIFSNYFDDAPRIIDDIIIIVAFIPLYRLLPREFKQRFRGHIIALAVLTILARTIGLLPHLALIHRVFLLLLSLATLLVLHRGLRKPTVPESEERVRVYRFARMAAYLAWLGLVLAVIFNVVGGVSPASLLTSGVLLSAFVGVAFYVFYHVLSSALWVFLKSPIGQKSRMIRQHPELIYSKLSDLLRIGLTLLWVWRSLAVVGLRSYVVEFTELVFTSDVTFGNIGISLSDIIGVIVVIWGASLLSRLIRFILDEDVYWRLSLARGVPNAVSTGIHYVIMFFGFILAVAAAGVDLDKFTILAGAFGVGLGFGLQDIVNNFVSGIILILERPIMPGDTVQMGTIGGEVTRIGMRSSTIRTWEGSEMIVPNGNLISKELINWTLSDKMRRIDVQVGVAYGTDVQQVMETLVAVAKDHPDVEEMPSPYALFLGFGDSSLNFELRSWITRNDRFLAIRSEVTAKVERALRDAGITIPFPQRDLHIKSDGRDIK